MNLRDIHSQLVIPVCALEEQVKSGGTNSSTECAIIVLRKILNEIEEKMMEEKS